MLLMPCHQYQWDRCREFMKPILNVACKEDPAKLGEDYGAINIDIEDYDIETQVDLYSAVQNFQRMSALQLTFPQESFAHVVLGEFLEHCTFAAAAKVLSEVRRVLAFQGRVTLTFPRDSDVPEKQRPPNELYEYCDGITSWHQTVWTDSELETLFAKTGFVELPQYREELDYFFCNCKGVGLVLTKSDS